MAKIVVGVTIVEFCKGGTQIQGGRRLIFRIVYTRVGLSCERLVSRFPISIFQEHVPIQYHYDRMFIRHQRPENSPVTTQKSPANVW